MSRCCRGGSCPVKAAAPIRAAPLLQPMAAVSALGKARSQLDLARTAESRSRGLYEQKAGALKDWQQAQAQLVAAENDVRAAETALEATRQRLRIIGRSDAEIGERRDDGRLRARDVADDDRLHASSSRAIGNSR